VTLAPGRRRATPTAKRGVVLEIAERRRQDVLAEVEATSLGEQLDRALATPAPRPIVERLAQPGLHLVAEIKRASPSAGRIAEGNEDIVARARAYEAGGAAAISVLCEPHWFGGSLDDVRAVRAAVSIPVLAKEFVVEDIQLPLLRAAGADLVLLLAVLHPPKRLARLVERALAIGLEPFVEAHDDKELRAALATDARLIGLNNRDLRTLDVEPTRAERLRSLVPDDRLVVAESGVRDASVVARWRALGFDAALVGEALMRSADPIAAVRSFVSAGRAPDDPANVARRPFVKICGVTDADGVLAAIRAGADAIGLNLAPESPRRLALGEAAELARLARVAAPPERPTRSRPSLRLWIRTPSSGAVPAGLDRCCARSGRSFAFRPRTRMEWLRRPPPSPHGAISRRERHGSWWTLPPGTRLAGLAGGPRSLPQPRSRSRFPWSWPAGWRRTTWLAPCGPSRPSGWT
jgi:indole-3-glycerol phosphate synthase